MAETINGYTWETCITCGCRFAMPADMWRNKHANKGTFFCPSGHHMAYIEGEADKLRRERDLLKQQMARIEEEKAVADTRAFAAEQKAKRLQKRAARSKTYGR